MGMLRTRQLLEVMPLKQNHFPEGKMPRESGEVRPPRVAARKRKAEPSEVKPLLSFQEYKSLHNLNLMPI